MGTENIKGLVQQRQAVNIVKKKKRIVAIVIFKILLHINELCRYILKKYKISRLKT